MELRGEDKEREMPSSLGYNNSADHSERRKGGDQTVHHEDAPSQALDHRHRQNPASLYHLQHLHTDKLTKDLEPDPNPVSAPPRSDPRLPPPPPSTRFTVVRYRECQKNHAASTGGHVLDGCGEFMRAGEEGTPDSLRCAACECHRSFHRKEVDGEHSSTYNNYKHSFYTMVSPSRSNPQRNQIISHSQPPQQPSLHYHHHHHVSPIMMSFGGGGGPAESSTEDLNTFHQSFNINGVDQQQPKRRIRTKFNQEQKERMFEFAEKIGWRLTKQEEEELQRFCSQVNVKRQAFKIWMHNNKQAMKKKQM